MKRISSVWRSSSFSRSSSEVLITLSAPTGRSPANRGTHMCERSPIFARIWGLSRSSSSAYSINSGPRAAIANRETLSLNRRLVRRNRSAIPHAARVFSVADVSQLLGAPLRRAELVLGRLIRGLLMWTGAAAVVGGLVVVGVAGHHRGVDAVRAAAFVVTTAILGLLGVVGAALVAGSERVDRATRRAAWPAGPAVTAAWQRAVHLSND